jgi:hypothetical protein
MDDALAQEMSGPNDQVSAALGGGMPLAAHQTPRADAAPPAGQGSGLSRREILVGAGGTGLLAAVGAGTLRVPAASAASRTASAGDGTPEQVHLTWGNDPATSVVVSWAAPGRAVRPRVVLDRGAGGREVISAHARSYTDGLNRPVPGTAAGTWTRAAADAVEDATWSAMRDPATGYGVAVFDLDPGEPGGETSITVTYHHAVGAGPANASTGVAGAPNPDYTPFETFTLVRPRSDGHGQRGQAAATGTASHAG